MNNICEKTDSYKLNHWDQYFNGTEYVTAYYEARKGAQFDEVVFFGLQYILKKHLVGEVVTEDKINQARFLSAIHFGQATIEKLKPYILNNYTSFYVERLRHDEDGRVVGKYKTVNPNIRIDFNKYFVDTKQKEYFNISGWTHILNEYQGRLPIKIKAVKEGTVIPISNVMITVENTDPKCYWLTNYLETLLSQVWYPCTVATLSREIKKINKRFLDKNSTGGMLEFMLQDFGFRGATTYEAASIGGAAHLVNFMGTDTVPAMEFAMAFYSAELDGLAYSVAATEHSIMTPLGRDGETKILDQLLTNYQTGILSVVSDSFNIYKFVDEIVGQQFKDRILARNGVFVVRPDSVTPEHPTPETEMVWLAQSLYKNFGGTINSKGYKVINPKVRLLWGDGIDITGIEKILVALDEAGFAAENVACFGMGGGLLQRINRDTLRFAFKSNAQKINGVWHDVSKQPKDVTKASKKGKIKLIKDNEGKFKTVSVNETGEDILQLVFENGELFNEINFNEVRENAKLI